MHKVMYYKGYEIKEYDDGTFDVTEDGDLVDGGFEGYEECKRYIDGLLNT